MELYYGMGLDRLSAKWFGYDTDFDGAHPRIEQSYFRVAENLMAELSTKPAVQIEYGARVSCVSVKEDGKLAVTYQQMGLNHGDLDFTPTRCIDADYVVVTCSLGVLKAGLIKFQPSLPARHLGAISSLGFGGQDRLMLEFTTRFWPDDCGMISVVPESSPAHAFEFFVTFPSRTKDGAKIPPLLAAFIP